MLSFRYVPALSGIDNRAAVYQNAPVHRTVRRFVKFLDESHFARYLSTGENSIKKEFNKCTLSAGLLFAVDFRIMNYGLSSECALSIDCRCRLLARK